MNLPAPVAWKSVHPIYGEDRIIQLLRQRFGKSVPSVKRSIGDDAAVFLPRGASEYWAFTTDLLLEDIDFHSAWISPEDLGHKALAVSLSDLAAMGVRPRYYTVALAMPRGITERWISRFYRGMTALGTLHGAHLVGGDLSGSTQGILVSVAALGESLRKKVVYRSGGKAGDFLYVTGVLGKSASGLRLLKMGRIRGDTRSERLALGAHRRPKPRCDAGLWLAQSGLVNGMMDISDGLSIDLPRLCEASGTGAEICGSSIPVFSESEAWQCNPLETALHGGEDFELLFSVASKNVPLLEVKYPPTLTPIYQIGRLRRRAGVVWESQPGTGFQPLPSLGFNHFRS